jgi:hypothetical protein
VWEEREIMRSWRAGPNIGASRGASFCTAHGSRRAGQIFGIFYVVCIGSDNSLPVAHMYRCATGSASAHTYQ